jgi:glycosyltransferase involved in cell wall biosynthesis
MSHSSLGTICLVANTEWYLYNFRLALAKELRSIGWEVIMISPPGPYAAMLEGEGFIWQEWLLNRRGLNLWQELNSLIQMVKIYRKHRPLLVHHFTVKPVMYGSLAAKLVGVRGIVNSITGLGYIFLRPGWQGAALRALVMPLYRLAIKHKNVRVIFENRDDEKYFLTQHLVLQEQVNLIEGVGVNVEHYQPEPEQGETSLVVMPARILWDKGVGVLVEAARIIKEKGEQPPMRIALVGLPDEGNPASIDVSQLQEWVADGVVEHWGFQGNMAEVYRQAHIVCLPSLREGLPTVLIEAAAAGRPIVASDVPGCRAVVEDGKNGLLVPPGDPEKLAQALLYLASNPSVRQKMGHEGRLIALDRFANEKIIAANLVVYSELLQST